MVSGIKKYIRNMLPLWAVSLYLRVRYGPPKLVYKSIVPEYIAIRQGQYSGQRCFIVGGGPSINQMDLTPLNDEYCMAVNRGFLLKDKGLHHVEFYGLSDIGAYAEYGREVPADFAEHFCIFGEIPWDRKDVKNLSAFSMHTEHCKQKFMSKGFFQFDLTHPVAHTYTIALQMLQIAVFAGFKDIYFIGIDNNFSGTNMHFYPDSEAEKKNIKDWRFDPCPDNEKAFQYANSILQSMGINLYNAGVGGNLKALRRIDFKELF